MLEWAGTECNSEYALCDSECWTWFYSHMQLHLSCGTENKVLTVAEPEKCEYHMTATTPALCLPLEDSGKNKEEL